MQVLSIGFSKPTQTQSPVRKAKFATAQNPPHTVNRVRSSPFSLPKFCLTTGFHRKMPGISLNVSFPTCGKLRLTLVFAKWHLRCCFRVKEKSRIFMLQRILSDFKAAFLSGFFRLPLRKHPGRYAAWLPIRVHFGGFFYQF